MRIMSRAPWAMMVRFRPSITRGRTERPLGGELSVPLMKTSLEVHSSHFLIGALMAFCTSGRSK